MNYIVGEGLEDVGLWRKIFLAENMRIFSENPIAKCLSKKVMYNQHDSYMHTPISAFACYNTPLQASYQSDTCKRRTTPNRELICGGCLIILPPPTGQCVRFFILTEFYGQTLCVCRACFPTCISQLTSSP